MILICANWKHILYFELLLILMNWKGIMKNGAKLLVECLEAHGVTHIFGIPGGKILPVYDALIGSSIKLVLCRHEQNAAFIAGMYGRLTGKPGVVLVTSGPGVGNLITGLLTATTEGDPIIAIGGCVPRAMQLKATHQSADNLALMEAATKARMEVLVADSIPEVVSNAFRIAVEPHAGAVFINFPQDVGREQTTVKAPHALEPVLSGGASEKAIKEALSKINSAKHPVLLLGQESTRPENCAAIRALIEKAKIPVVSTYQAAGVVPRELLSYFAGRVGLFNNQPADVLLNQSDLVISIGFNPIEYDPEVWNKDNTKSILHINYDRAAIRFGYFPVLELCGDIASTVQKLTESSLPHSALDYKKISQDYLLEIEAGKKHNGMPIHPLRFIYELRNLIDDGVIVACDIGTNYIYMARYFLSFNPHHLLFSNGQQTLGVGLPWAMAAKIVHPDKTIVSISGDGGFLFSAMELETAVREKLHFVHFIWVNGGYGMIKDDELRTFNRTTAISFGNIDTVKFAESFGARGYKVSSADDLAPTIRAALKGDGPVLVEIPIDYRDSPELFGTLHHGID